MTSERPDTLLHNCLWPKRRKLSLWKPKPEPDSEILDSNFNFNSHIKSITNTVLCHLKDTERIRGFKSRQDFEKLIRDFISSWLDYCNFPPQQQTEAPEHIASVLIEFKLLLLLVSKSLSGSKINLLISFARWTLSASSQSSGRELLNLPRVQSKHRETAFSYSCNKLPEDIRLAPTPSNPGLKKKKKAFKLCCLWLNLKYVCSLFLTFCISI